MVWRQLLRFVLALFGLVACFCLIVDAAKSGLSRLNSTLAIIQSRIEPADIAVRLNPSDPEAHYTRGLTLVNLGRLGDAVVELDRATQLRPHHYYEWLDLGVTRDRLGDQAAADAALRESVRLAPFFAQPRWQLGNLLYRQERFEEAFEQLRLGARSNPNLRQALMDLAWVAANGDVSTMEHLVNPQDSRSHIELARFFEGQGKSLDAVRQATAAGKLSDEDERAVLHEIVAKLVASRRFPEAYAIWAADHNRPQLKGAAPFGEIQNGDFVEQILQNDPGFGWQLAQAPNFAASIDPSGPRAGARSILFDFSGDSVPSSLIIHQLVLTEPKSTYSLEFMARADHLVSGGPPVVVISDASSEDRKVLAQSNAIGPGTVEWVSFKMDFSTAENTGAVDIGLQRLACNQNPCPVFGRLWLGGFTLRKR